MATFKIPSAPNVSGLEPFLAVLNRYGAGPAQACRFVVQIGAIRNMFDPDNVKLSTIPNAVTYLCEQAELPGKALIVNDARYYGPNFKFPVQTAYTDITMNFIVRDELIEKQFFDNWMMSINPTDNYDFLYKVGYSSDINIIQYSALAEDNSSKSHATYMLTLRKAFPINVAPMGLMWGEENFHRLSVTFAYTEWTRIDDPARSGYSLVTTEGGKPVQIVTESVLGSTSPPVTQTYTGNRN
jgi:hypothetical protein